MIRSFNDDDTEHIFYRQPVRRYQTIQNGAFRKLRVLDSAESLKDLQALPGNHLEKLKGDRTGQYSIRINNQFRVCFEWRNGDAYQVEIVDYH